MSAAAIGRGGRRARAQTRVAFQPRRALTAASAVAAHLKAAWSISDARMSSSWTEPLGCAERPAGPRDGRVRTSRERHSDRAGDHERSERERRRGQPVAALIRGECLDQSAALEA